MNAIFCPKDFFEVGFRNDFDPWCGVGLSGCQNGDASGDAHADMTTNPTEILKDFEMNDTKNGIKTMTLISTEARIYEAQHYADVDQPLLYFYKAGKNPRV